MKTSTAGINLIKQFEGCRLTAYKPVPTEKYWTIGYGHYGQDVTPGMKISQGEAEILLGIDLVKYELAVEKYSIFPLSQTQFDALVSFAYNCGIGNLQKLLAGRNALQVAEAMLKYNKAGGKVLNGLTKRRQTEHDLFCKDLILPRGGNPYREPTKNVRLNSKGNDVRWLQYSLNSAGHYGLIIDGIAGEKTISALKNFQQKAFPNAPNEWDGICGAKTREALKQAQ
jgi:GH24 family phage-related lysozyme (muramidase)